MAKPNWFLKVARSFATPFCLCKKCPSYPGKGDKVVYCEHGKSGYPIEWKGCLCGNCPIWKINRFKNKYYCQIGKDPESII